jgi:transposase-like protein
MATTSKRPDWFDEQRARNQARRDAESKQRNCPHLRLKTRFTNKGGGDGAIRYTCLACDFRWDEPLGWNDRG